MEVKARMTSPFHAQANGAAEKTNQTLKQVLRTVVMAKQQEPTVGPTPNLLIRLDMVEIAINNAPIANTGLSPFYLNLVYHPHFWFVVPNFDEVRVEGENTIQMKYWIAKMRADLDLVYRALYHEQTRAETFATSNGLIINSRWDMAF